jgi:glyoxylase-like metal-dependent hydrolase (beta-lactamase superfamily II)
MPLDGDAAEMGFMRAAHTDGDIYVRFPTANVIVAGGAASNAGWPIIDWSTGGWLGGMIDALTTIAGMSDGATKIVPADGPVMTKADVERQIAMYQTILDRMAADLRASLGPDEMAAKSPTAEFDAEMGDPTQFVMLAYQSAWAQIRTDRRVGAI